MFGSEQGMLCKTWPRRILWKIRGDFHVGRWARHFCLKKALKEFRINPQMVLDAGCGKGQTSYYLAREFSCARIHGVDLSQENIQFCKRLCEGRNEKLRFSTLDLAAKPLEESYDLVVMTTVLCEILDYKSALRNVLSSLRPGGWIVFQDMNGPYLKKKYGVEGRAYKGGVHTFSIEQLKPEFEKMGFEMLCSRVTLGSTADVAHRIFDKLRSRSLLLSLCCPFLIALVFLDALTTPAGGAGILIAAKRKV